LNCVSFFFFLKTKSNVQSLEQGSESYAVDNVKR